MPHRRNLASSPSRLAALALALACAAPGARAADRVATVVVDSPDFRPLPLAIPAFLADAEGRAATEATAVLRADLTLSGLFEVLDPRGYLADPGEGLAAPSIKFTRWVSVGAEGLVKARVHAEAGGLVADLRVHDVRGGRERLARTVAAPDARALAHRLADEIIRHYTGEPGPFRSQIVAVRQGRGTHELVLFDADGGNPRVLLTERTLLMLPAWHPDGDRILVVSYRDQREELWVYRRSDRSFRKLPLGHKAFGGAFSPDGTKLAFVNGDRSPSEIWLADADGRNARPFVASRGDDLSPAWSPDGRQLAFVSSRAGTPQLYVQEVGGAAPKRITFKGNYNQEPGWNPRGDPLVFTARDERNAFDVFTVTPGAPTPRRITQDQGSRNMEPTWAPTGRLLAFTSDRTGSKQLVISDPRGERQVVVTAGPPVETPAWGPLPRD
jgi:TolB protein